MTIHEATASYEKWLGRKLRLVPADLELKHQSMQQAAFPFLRATFYRFAQLWSEHAGELSRAPKVLGVGDLHVANFGTWRDTEGRLVWGINDFDEAFPLPYTLDLVRLATSAAIARAESSLSIGQAAACDAILSGYLEGLSSGGCPFVLSEHHKWLRDAVTSDLRDPVLFWRKMSELGNCPGDVPDKAMRALNRLLPVGAEVERVALRIAGLGSLGRERYVLLAMFYGSRIAREAKALASSACVWAQMKGSNDPHYEEMLGQAVRARDPYVHVTPKWIVRRLAPYCSRVELSSLPAQRDENKLLRAMGLETANIHLGTNRAGPRIVADLEARPTRWLRRAAQQFRELTESDFADWKKPAV